MKIALIRPPATYADWYRHPHYSLSCLAAYLEANEIECRIFDAYFNQWTSNRLTSEVVKYCPDVVGISAMTHEIAQAAIIAGEIKKAVPKTISIVGGCHVTALPERTLNEFLSFDFGITGEGEKPLLALLKYVFGMDGGRDPCEIQGLVYRVSNRVEVNGASSPMTSDELDSLQFPAYDQYYGGDKRALASVDAEYRIMATRGCPYKCAFCMQVSGRRLRRRSAEGVINEIEYAMSTYGAHTFRFQDEILVADTAYSRRLFELLAEVSNSHHIRWSAQTRANLVTDDIIALAKKAGCYLLGMGVESGDDQILRQIHKQITVAQAKTAARIIKEKGIRLGAYYIIGHPHENRQSAQATIDLAVELNSDTIAVGIMVPYPGTEIYQKARNGEWGYRLLSEDWSTYDKYGNEALALDELSSKELRRLQQKAYLLFYLKNGRLRELVTFLWQKRRAFFKLFRFMRLGA